MVGGGIEFNRTKNMTSWNSSTIWILLLLLIASEPVEPKKKIVKLIVPHKIKYIHHTHVLLLRPAKKKTTKAHLEEEGADERPAGYKHMHYHHDSRAKSKPQVHYVVPFIAEAKEGNYRNAPSREEDETYIIPFTEDYRKRSRVREEVHPISKAKSLHRGLRVPFDEGPPTSSIQKTRYVYETQNTGTQPPYPPSLATKTYIPVSDPYHPPPDPYHPPSEPYRPPSESYNSEPYAPESYENEYNNGYNSYGERGPISLTADEGGWGGDSYSVPEKSTGRDFYKASYYHDEKSRYSRNL